jgi:hypothetical protein
MAYRDFTIPELKRRFQLVIDESSNRFATTRELDLPAVLADPGLEEGLRKTDGDRIRKCYRWKVAGRVLESIWKARGAGVIVVAWGVSPRNRRRINKRTVFRSGRRDA